MEGYPYRTKYLEFRYVVITTRKTPMVTVINHQTGVWLGRILWYGPWFQFCFFPEEKELVFNRQCLDDISAEIEKLMAARRKR